MSISELQEIRRVFQGLQSLYQTHLPKVDPALIHDLLVREEYKRYKDTSSSSFRDTSSSSSSSQPFYMVEIKTVAGTDQEEMKNLIFEKTGLLPSIHENGTHYVANMRLSLELLKAICDSQEGIMRLSGDYTGGISGR
jgi:hypothetical protein